MEIDQSVARALDEKLHTHLLTSLRTVRAKRPIIEKARLR